MTRQDELNEAWCKYMGKCSTEIIQALAFALRWADANPCWLSVEDELPKTEEPYFDYNDEVCDDLKCSNKVLVIANNDFHIATLNQNYNDGEPTGTPYWFDEERSECGDWLNGKVTHWMPMPAPPILSKMENTKKKGGAQ